MKEDLKAVMKVKMSRVDSQVQHYAEQSLGLLSKWITPTAGSQLSESKQLESKLYFAMANLLLQTPRVQTADKMLENILHQFPSLAMETQNQLRPLLGKLHHLLAAAKAREGAKESGVSKEKHASNTPPSTP